MPKRGRSQRGGEGTAGRGNGVVTYQKGGEGTQGRVNGVQLVTSTGAAPTLPAELPATQKGGALEPLNPSQYGSGPFTKSQYYTISGGSRRRKYGKKNGSKRRNRSQRGGTGVLATAAVPFGLLALQRYFKGSRTSKRGVAKMGRSFKRTFRRRY